MEPSVQDSKKKNTPFNFISRLFDQNQSYLLFTWRQKLGQALNVLSTKNIIYYTLNLI